VEIVATNALPKFTGERNERSPVKLTPKTPLIISPVEIVATNALPKFTGGNSNQSAHTRTNSTTQKQIAKVYDKSPLFRQKNTTDAASQRAALLF
jgi:hypothetical protein